METPHEKTTFCLCVDEFGVKCFSEADKKHLIQALESKYIITTNDKGTDFCGLHLDWNYNQRWVDISMPEYVIKTLIRLEHPFPSKPKHAPHRWIPTVFGQKFI